jgi:hypothetical protein
LFYISLHLGDTLALHVDSSAFIAELEFALAGHVVAAFVFLHPELALGTLLEFLALHEVHEEFVVLAGSAADFVLLAGHVFVPVHPAVQTVLFFALQALESLVVVLFVEEHVITVGSRTPRSI